MYCHAPHAYTFIAICTTCLHMYCHMHHMPTHVLPYAPHAHTCVNASVCLPQLEAASEGGGAAAARDAAEGGHKAAGAAAGGTEGKPVAAAGAQQVLDAHVSLKAYLVLIVYPVWCARACSRLIRLILRLALILCPGCGACARAHASLPARLGFIMCPGVWSVRACARICLTVQRPYEQDQSWCTGTPHV